jgi:Ran-binding protein 1
VVTLEKIEVKTHEEEEDVVYVQRAKLFTFGETLLDKGTGNKTWKERGVGDCKFLRHKENSRIRVLMRQEKTMKVIVNLFLDPRIVMVPNSGSDKSWVWVAFDFADGELVETTFAIRFASSEIALAFKAEFTKCQKEMDKLLGGEDSTEGADEADAAADAIASLSVKPDEEKEEVQKDEDESPKTDA